MHLNFLPHLSDLPTTTANKPLISKYTTKFHYFLGFPSFVINLQPMSLKWISLINLRELYTKGGM